MQGHLQFSFMMGILLWLAAAMTGCGGRANSVESSEPNKMAALNMQLGTEYMRRGQFDIARDRLHKAVEIDPQFADGYNALGVLYERTGQNAEAEQYYERALSLNGKDANIHNNYGQFLCKLGQWDRAQQHFALAYESPFYPTPEIPYTNAGLCALHSKNYAQAEGFFRRVLQTKPEYPFALYQMASLSYENRQLDAARDYIKRYLRVAKHTAETLLLGFKVERSQGNQSAAQSYANMLRSQFPDSEEVRLLNQLEKP